MTTGVLTDRSSGAERRKGRTGRVAANAFGSPSAELFSAERLEEHARTLATAQTVSGRGGRSPSIWRRVADDGRALESAYRTMAGAIRDERAITPAAEWLVDNFPIVDEQIREIRDDLPRRYYRQLPKLESGHLSGYPRVFGLAWAYVAHTASRFDPDTLRRMVIAYQAVEPLTIGELWAVAINLRVVLVENLRLLSDDMVSSRAGRLAADEIADQLLGLRGNRQEDADDALRRLRRQTLSPATEVQLFQRLREQDPASTPAVHWLEDRLIALGTTVDEVVRLEHQRQATLNVTVRNVITSMRLISWFDWAGFVESVSLPDRVLRDGDGVYREMDFETRDTYRKAIEELGRGTARGELDAATTAVAMAAAARADPAAAVPPDGCDPAALADRSTEPGYYLIAEGRPALERALHARVAIATRLRRAYSRFPATGYLVSVWAMTIAVVGVVAWLDLRPGGGRLPVLLVAVFAVVPVSDLALAMVNRMVTRVLGPVHFARLDLDEGIPASLRTLVVVPALLTSESDVKALVDTLEVHYLSNRSGEVRFALLTDWVDATTEEVPGDQQLLALALAGVDDLNARHGEPPGGGARFFLFHRHRRWNNVEECWMGWERKRGKLEELNALLRGATDTTIVSGGRPSTTPPTGVRYVITLDSDTRLPRGAVGQLVGAIAHPLNQPRIDPTTGRVTEGYGVLQPRITPDLPTSHGGSLFQQLFGGPAGIDPYSAAVSDVYQDLFQEGSFTGKGIYDVDAFASAMRDRVPENTLLSHDLFEGVFARAGLVTDIELFDAFPADYLVSSARQHRWARGDWQLLPWILGRPPRGSVGSQLPAVSRWKMVDNLRRSLSAPCAIATLIAAWALPSVSSALWVALIVGLVALPAVPAATAALVPKRRGISKQVHFRGAADDITAAAGRVALGLILLAHQAWLMLDAIGRTLARMFVTHRHLLEWTTAAQSAAASDLGLRAFVRRMIGAEVIAVFTAVLVALTNPGALVLAAPFLVCWAWSPWVGRRISVVRHLDSSRKVDEGDARALRLVARRTWSFFETFVGPKDHWLPPDNVQEIPELAIAHRTSPTNIGLYLLSTVTARDFGWIGTVEMIDRLEQTIDTLSGLEVYRGHLYNWYDTSTATRLDPDYISSVDSGNLAGHLLTVASACRRMIDEPIPAATALAGIGDAVELCRRSAASLGDRGTSESLGVRDLLEALDVRRRPETVPVSTAEWTQLLDELATYTDALSDIAVTLAAQRPAHADAGAEVDLVMWTAAARSAVASHRHDLGTLHAQLDNGEPSKGFLTLAELAEHPDNVGPAGDPPAGAVLRRLNAVADRAGELFDAMDFGFLFDQTRKLFSIGYRVGAGELDESYYDLLASESRLGSFLAIAKGDVPVEHWFRLGRSLTPVGRGAALISWSGSMFEYLMPSLVMRTPDDSLLGQTNRLVVRRQIAYGDERHVPWGISESGYNTRDLGQAYQYSGFGVPGLGLKRGLREDLVIAPYATGLATMVDPTSSVRNFERLSAAGASGRHGFHEAIDYTPRRLPEDSTSAVVRSYMSHHQGMILVAIGNVLNDWLMTDRFHATSIVESTELLLQERVPRNVLVARPRAEEVKSDADVRELVPPMLRRFTSPHDVIPRTHLLSNGRYAVMVTAAGSGYSRVGDLDVTRWREDPTCDSWGSYLYVREMYTGAVRSVGHQPSGVEADTYEVTYSEDRAEFTRRDGSIITKMTIVVPTEHDAEIRRVAVTNLSTHVREIELTSYAEIVLAPHAADVAHPAFQNLFVQTEFVSGIGALVATRRPRAHGEQQRWAAHVAAVEEGSTGVVQYETDRSRFCGRGRTLRTPVSVMDGRPLTNTVGAVLDPIFSLRVRVKVAPGATVHTIFSTVVADSREQVLDLADKYREAATFERAAILAWTQAQVQLHHLGIDADEAHLFQRLANRIIYSDPSLRPAPALLARNEMAVSALWALGISGDLPIVVVRVNQGDDINIVRQLLRAHEYWRMKLLAVDLVIINEQGTTYAEDLQGAVETVVRTSRSMHSPDDRPRHGSVFVFRGDQLTDELRTLLQTAARVVVLSRHGNLVEQVERLERPEQATPTLTVPARRATAVEDPAGRPELEYFNGLGGFADDGREYVTILGPEQSTPAPWLNVIANESFGFQVSAAGSGYTWSTNSRENQLTPWSNDPVGDPPGEVIYVRDDDTGEVWGPTALPVRCPGSTYIARHGAGYSTFEHLHLGIHLSLLQFVPLDHPLKCSVLSIENRSATTRRLTVTTYTNWVLGSAREQNAAWVVTARDAATGVVTAHNARSAEFGGRVAFVDLNGAQTAWTADRTEFLGRNRSVESPAGLDLAHRLRATSGPGLDPCAVLQTTVVLGPGDRTDVRGTIGEAASAAALPDLVRTARSIDHVASLADVRRFWNDTQRAIQVRTPDRSMDIMLNGWLTYQTLACRLWARAAFYQAGGAYGFRDQLQDVIALAVPRRDLAREHILRAAAQQFVEGDVQHWWHPPSGRGVRTRISDDRAWLPYVVDRYLATTDDLSILDEMVPFIDGPTLRADQVDAYFQPERSALTVSLYEHCAAAIDRTLEVGVHGLPLMGTGDWNDGMDRVGHEGRGESIWLGWFLCSVLDAFAPIADSRSDHEHASVWRTHRTKLAVALEAHGWDGDWYRRAYFDDGTPLGSAVNTECRIDSIAQSWAVISGAGDRARSVQAMASVQNYLVRLGDGLVRLFTPPFDHSDLDPGYIKGYLPGIRENGGQYTHGAIWSVLAFAGLGDGDRAAELFSVLNPINHTSTRAGVHRYKVEPYVIAADVYGEEPHVGRGGWTWYTGSAGWMYRAGIESILGFYLRGTSLVIDPCIPRAWNEYRIVFQYHGTRYQILVENPHGVSRGVSSIMIDERPLDGGVAAIPLVDDGVTHQVHVTLG